MAYSLKNHEDRIAKLESKIGAGGGIVESKLANPGYVKFANGLIVNFGTKVAGNTFTFAKAFTNLALALGCRSAGGGWEHSVILKNVGKTSCYVDCRGYDNQFKGETIHIIAIGY